MDGPPMPVGTNLKDNAQTRIIVAVTFTWALALVAVSLRFLARRITRTYFWWDDYFTLPALGFATALCFMTDTWLIQHGLGKHIWANSSGPNDAITVFLKGLVFGELAFALTIVFVKYSLLCFYWRLFKTSTLVKQSIYILAAMVTAWGIGVILVICFQCIPLRGFWDKNVSATCGVDAYKFFYGNSIPNILTDVAIMVLPIRSILGLKITVTQKAYLCGIFLLGAFVIGVSISRLIILIKLDWLSPDLTWTCRNPQIWTCLEMNIGIVCSCLPSLRPILSFISGKAASQVSQGSKSTPAPNSGTFPWPTTRAKHSSFRQDIGDMSEDDKHRLFYDTSETRAETGSTAEHGVELTKLGSASRRTINIQREVDIQWQ